MSFPTVDAFDVSTNTWDAEGTWPDVPEGGSFGALTLRPSDEVLTSTFFSWRASDATWSQPLVTEIDVRCGGRWRRTRVATFALEVTQDAGDPLDVDIHVARFVPDLCGSVRSARVQLGARFRIGSFRVDVARSRCENPAHGRALELYNRTMNDPRTMVAALVASISMSGCGDDGGPAATSESSSQSNSSTLGDTSGSPTSDMTTSNTVTSASTGIDTSETSATNTTSDGAESSSTSGGSEASRGCSLAADEALGQWVDMPDLTIRDIPRDWGVRLPNGYDPNVAYPLIFLFHGCGSPINNVPMENVIDEGAILVRGAGITDGCWDASPEGADVELFDAMLAETFASYCIDTERVFGVGYSSGSWLVNTLECVRGDVLRANGSVAGGTPGPTDSCVGTVARAFVHDTEDESNLIEWNVPERDRLIELNHCTQDTAQLDPRPCVSYQGCDEGYPVIWCETSGRGHDRQDDFAPAVFWNLFSAL